MRTLADLTRDPDRTPATIGVLAPDHAAALRLARRLGDLPEVSQAVWLDSFVPADQPAKLAAIGDAALLLDVAINPFDIAPPPDDAELGETLPPAERSAGRGSAARTPAPARGQASRLAEAFARLARADPAERAELGAVLTRPLSVTLDQIRAMLAAESITAAQPPARAGARLA